MANVTITQLPAAGPITGTESVPIVQNGQTVQTTTAAIAASPSQFQTFLTLNNEPTLANSRYLSTGTGLGLSDGGAQSDLEIILNGASGSLEAAGNGVIVKTGSTTVTARTISTSGAGLTISNGNGVSGNPTIALDGLAASLANMGGTGVLGVVGGSSITSFVITGTTNQIDVANGAGPGNPTISISTNPILPGTGAVTIPKGTTAQRPGGVDGMIRFNTETSAYETFDTTGGWSTLPSGAVTQIDTGTGLTGGPITSSGTISIANTGVVAGVYGSQGSVGSITLNAQGQATSATNVVIEIDASQITAGTLTSDKGGTGLNTYTSGDLLYYDTGVAFSQLSIGASNYVLTSNGSAPQWTDPTTIAIGNATNLNGGATGSIPYQASSSNTTFLALGTTTYLLRAGASAPEYADPSTITVGTATNLASGAAGSIPYQTASGVTAMLATSSGVLVGGTTPSYSTAPSLTGTNFTSIPNAALDNSAVTIGTTSISLGSSSLTLGGLTTVTVTQDPTNALDLATKQYVDGLVVSGIHYHAPVRVESPINLNATYNNGASGVGATLTNAGTQAALVIDGVTLNLNDRVLIYTQTDQTQNGIYYVSDVGSVSTNWELTRATDADTYGLASPTTLGEGSTVFVQEGATGAGELYTCNTAGVITFGTTNITFVQILSAQIYSAGAGLNLSGTQFSVATNGISDAMLRQSTGLSVIGRSTNSTGNVADITAASDYQVLRRSGTSIGFGAIDVSQSGAVTGTLATGNGGTGLATYTAGDIVYYAAGTALTALAIGATNRILTSSGTAPQWSDPANITVGTASNITVTDNTSSSSTYYPVVSLNTTGSNAPTTSSTKLSFVPSTGVLSATGFSGALNGTVGATTPDAGTFTTLTVTGQSDLGLNGSNNQTFRAAAGTGAFPWVQSTHASGSARLRAVPTAGSAELWLSSTGTSAIRFYTQAHTDEQFRVANTASAVNYVQVTGAATGGRPFIQAQGSDTNVDLRLGAKGFGGVYSTAFFVAGAQLFNNVLIQGAATGASPYIQASGGDTNIDLALTPKGTGRVTTAAAIVATGGISGGTF